MYKHDLSHQTKLQKCILAKCKSRKLVQDTTEYDIELWKTYTTVNLHKRIQFPSRGTSSLGSVDCDRPIILLDHRRFHFCLVFALCN